MNCRSVLFPAAEHCLPTEWRAGIGSIRHGVPVLWHAGRYNVRSLQPHRSSRNCSNSCCRLPEFGESRQSIGRCIDSRFTLEYSSGKSGRKLARESEFIFRRCQYKIVCRLLLEGSFSFPTQRYIINGRIECTFENRTLRILKDYICSVFVVGIPIAGIIGMSARRVWKCSFTPARAGLVILAEIMSICG